VEASSANGIQERLDHEGDLYFPFDVNALKRLVRLQVLVMFVDHHDHAYCYQVAKSMQDVVQSVLDAGPWHALVASLLEDEQAVVLQIPGRHAADATIDQTRLIAHEVRNALIPVRFHLDAMLKSSDAAQRGRLETSRHGVVRVLAFVDEMVATSELLNEPPTSFEAVDIIRDALGWLDGGERVELEPPPGTMRIRAQRSRLQRALSNVVLNALQATSEGQRVRVRTCFSDSTVEIMVDDGGPGVPEDQRSVVFQDGFTTRGGRGGSGFGLAYVRRVVEEALHGKVWCEASDLGGARFVIAIPEGKADR
jgi:signal transduction histidine kinase